MNPLDWLPWNRRRARLYAQPLPDATARIVRTGVPLAAPFFERPRALKRQDPELYAVLARYYGQDPASGSP